MPDYLRLKAADARAGVADAEAAVPAIRALRETIVVPVAATDIRSVLWRTFEYGKLDALYEAGKRGDFSAYPSVPNMTNLDVFAAISTCLSFLNSGTTIAADQAGETDWQAVLMQVGGLVAMSLFQPSTYTAIVGMRQRSVPVIPDDEDFNASDVIAARSY